MTNNESQVKIGPKPIGTVQDDEEDDVDEVIGFLTFSTTGEALVPREWLLDQWENYNLPNYLLPSSISNWQAYRRMKNELLEDTEYSHYQVYNDEYDRHFNCKFELEKSDEMGSNTYIVYSKVFFPEEIIDAAIGEVPVLAEWNSSVPKMICPVNSLPISMKMGMGVWGLFTKMPANGWGIEQGNCSRRCRIITTIPTFRKLLMISVLMQTRLLSGGPFISSVLIIKIRLKD
jgi:hypothetical protein